MSCTDRGYVYTFLNVPPSILWYYLPQILLQKVFFFILYVKGCMRLSVSELGSASGNHLNLNHWEIIYYSGLVPEVLMHQTWVQPWVLLFRDHLFQGQSLDSVPRSRLLLFTHFWPAIPVPASLGTKSQTKLPVDYSVEKPFRGELLNVNVNVVCRFLRAFI